MSPHKQFGRPKRSTVARIYYLLPFILAICIVAFVYSRFTKINSSNLKNVAEVVPSSSQQAAKASLKQQAVTTDSGKRYVFSMR